MEFSVKDTVSTAYRGMRMSKCFLLLSLAITIPGPAAHGEVVDIDNKQLAELLAKDVAIVDVRTPGEWRRTGVIEGSHLLMFFDERGRYDLRNFATEIKEIVNIDKPVIVICRTGSRTVSIAPFLDQKVGYGVVYNVRKGIKPWIAAGNKVTKVDLP